MPTKSSLSLLGSLLLSSLLTATCFAQGSLTPPGAPGASMKSLDQVEARTPITSAAFNISSSGSYYLTTNLYGGSYGIAVGADNVTIDLNGFALIGPGSGTAINVNGNFRSLRV